MASTSSRIWTRRSMLSRLMAALPTTEFGQGESTLRRRVCQGRVAEPRRPEIGAWRAAMRFRLERGMATGAFTRSTTALRDSSSRSAWKRTSPPTRDATGMPSLNTTPLPSTAGTRGPGVSTPIRFSGSQADTATRRPVGFCLSNQTEHFNRLREREVLAYEARHEPAPPNLSSPPRHACIRGADRASGAPTSRGPAPRGTQRRTCEVAAWPWPRRRHRARASRWSRPRSCLHWLRPTAARRGSTAGETSGWWASSAGDACFVGRPAAPDGLSRPPGRAAGRSRRLLRGRSPPAATGALSTSVGSRRVPDAISGGNEAPRRDRNSSTAPAAPETSAPSTPGSSSSQCIASRRPSDTGMFRDSGERRPVLSLLGGLRLNLPHMTSPLQHSSSRSEGL